MKNLTCFVCSLAVGALVVADGALTTRRASAQDDGAFDHLQCFPIRDGSSQERFRVELEPRDGIFVDDDGNPVRGLPGNGCKVSPPARELCIGVLAALDDEMPGAPAGPEAGDFLCYTVRCPESNARERIEITDQFGTRSIDVLNRPSRLCVPAMRQAGAPTPAPSGTPGGAPPTPRPIQTPQPSGAPGPTPTEGSPSGAFVDRPLPFL